MHPTGTAFNSAQKGGNTNPHTKFGDDPSTTMLEKVWKPFRTTGKDRQETDRKNTCDSYKSSFGRLKNMPEEWVPPSLHKGGTKGKFFFKVKNTEF